MVVSVRVYFLAVIVVLAASLALASPPPVKSFVVYYGTDRVDELSKFDLAIVSPLLEEREVEELRDRGVIVLGYISLITLGGWEPWYNPTGVEVVGNESAWGEVIVNPCSEAWRNVVVRGAGGYLTGKGFSGFFLDNLDMVDAYPWMKPCVVGLVAALRNEYPGAVIIVNRGFTVLDEVSGYIDGVLFEDFATYYDFNQKKYLKWSGGDLEWVRAQAERLTKLREERGILVLALGYADINDPDENYEYSKYVNEMAAQYGFIPYTSEITLMKINALYPDILSQGEEHETKPLPPAQPPKETRTAEQNTALDNLFFILVSLTVSLLFLALVIVLIVTSRKV